MSSFLSAWQKRTLRWEALTTWASGASSLSVLVRHGSCSSALRRNEKAWGSVGWIVQLRKALNAAGFASTKLILGDGLRFDPQWLTAMETDQNFSHAIAGFGLHYPCLRNQNLPHPQVISAHKKLWSSEESSTLAGWPGAGCIGRSLNQNFVRMNMTATVAWSLIWSVYDDNSWPCSGKCPDDGSPSGPVSSVVRSLLAFLPDCFFLYLLYA